MPYSNRQKKNWRLYKKMRARGKAKTKVDKRQDRQIKRLISNVEKKYDLIYSGSAGSPGVATSVQITNNIGSVSGSPPFGEQILNVTPTVAEGTGDRNRIGDQYNLKTMDFEAVASYNIDEHIAAGSIAHCRVIVVWDNDPTYQALPTAQGSPVVADNPLSWNHLLQIGNAIVDSPVFSVDALNNDLVIRGKRCSIVADFKFDLVAGTSRATKRFNFKKFWKRMKLNYLASGTTALNRQLKCCFVSDRPSQEAPSLFYRIRYTYEDA